MTRHITLELPPQGIVEEKMPRVIKPMYALYSELPRDIDRYGIEYKWDGVRAIYFWNGITPFIQSRNMLDITDSYPEIKPLGSALGDTPFVLDGEIIALDEHGHASFNRLQHRFGIFGQVEAEKRARHIPVVYMIFDVLYADQYSLMKVPYEFRRKFLDTLDLAGPAWQITPWSIGHGQAILEAAGDLQLEGVVSKRLDSIYEPGRRSGAWIKTKLVMSQEFVIGGWTPYKGFNTSMIGALLVGYYRDGNFVYAGSVGTGFSDADRGTLKKILDNYSRPTNPFTGPAPRPDAFYTDPKLVAQIEFRGWTGANILRQPSFKGIRDDKDPTQIVREEITQGLVRP